jgi:hypothetical protein
MVSNRIDSWTTIPGTVTLRCGNRHGNTPVYLLPVSPYNASSQVRTADDPAGRHP